MKKKSEEKWAEEDLKNESEEGINYFIVTVGNWNVGSLKDGKEEEKFYKLYGNKGYVRDNFKLAKKGDKVVFYETSEARQDGGAVVALGEVAKGIHEKEKDGEIIEGILFRFTEYIGPIKYGKLVEEGIIKRGALQNSLNNLDKDKYLRILALDNEIDANDEIILKVNFNVKLAERVKDLYFAGQKGKIFERIEKSLKNGKHLILSGPPGTGKSKLAKEVAKAYVGENYKMVTATSDWSTFDTIGGYKPDRDGNLNFISGVFLDCFKNEGEADNTWLIIDEINRADIDKAFGSLFSALTGDPVTLSFKSENDRNIEIRPQEQTDDKKITQAEETYVVPGDWRIIATMNTYDKTSLYEMSYAFMRRFAFIPVPVPQKIDIELLEEYLKCWNMEEDYNSNTLNDMKELWKVINEVRKIGPAIIKDMFQYIHKNDSDGDNVDNSENFSTAIISLVLPQFEGIREAELNDFIKNLGELETEDQTKILSDKDIQEIKDFARDYFQMGSETSGL